MEAIEQLKGFRKYMSVLKGTATSTPESYVEKNKNFLSWIRNGRSSSSVDVTEITRQDIEGYLESCMYAGNSNRTRLGKLVAIRSFFGYLEYEEIITKNIAKKIPSPGANTTQVQVYTREEVLKILSVIDISTSRGQRDAVIIMLAVFCSLRNGEVAGLKMYDITLETSVEGTFKKASFNVGGPGFTPKRSSFRKVQLWRSPSLLVRDYYIKRIAQGANKESHFITSYRRGDHPTNEQIHSGGIISIVKQYAEMAGLSKACVTVHMLRATCATALSHVNGYDLMAIARFLGHRNIVTTTRYVSDWGRKTTKYPSLAAYWRGFEDSIWHNDKD